YAKKEGYLPAEKGAFVNNERNRIVIELKKNPTNIVVPEPTIIPEPEIVVANPPVEIIIGEDPKPSPPIKEPTPFTEETVSLEELDDDNFDVSFFASVNVVFVLDVSASMNQGD